MAISAKDPGIILREGDELKRFRWSTEEHVDDGQANSADVVTITVEDTTPPVITLKSDVNVLLEQGIWPDLDQNGIDRAGAANMLTSTEPTKPCMGSRTHSTPVEVGCAPEVS